MEAISPVGPASLSASAPVAKPMGAEAVSKDFASYMQSAAAESVSTIRDGEQAMTAGLQGTAGVQDVVNAVIAAETTLQTVMAIRDKAISAYNEILRMPI